MFIIKYCGGFANQIFQYCFMCRLKELYPNQIIKCDTTSFRRNSQHGGFKLSHFVNVEYAKRADINKATIIHECDFSSWEAEEGKDYLFDGYWQNECFFPSSLDILNPFFNEQILTEKQKLLLKEIESEQSVSVHVRRGDYVNNYLHGNIATKGYFQNAIQYIVDHVNRPVFYIFSDDIEWCKKNLFFHDKEVIFVDGSSKWVNQDIFLMSRCKHNIISNSSFSWWAQRINCNDDSIVVAPEYWYNDQSQTKALFVEKAITVKNYVEHAKVETPFFSVLIPAYNVEKYIRRCLVSVVNQSFDAIEIIVVDDGSTDNTPKIISQFAEKDCRIRMIEHHDNESLYMARYDAFEKANGEYCVLLDSDDYIDENACEILFGVLNKNKTDVVAFRYQKEPSKEIGMTVTYCDNFKVKILTGQIPLTVWDKCYSREVVKNALKKMGRFYCNLGEDAYNSILLLSEAKTYKNIDNVLIHYMESTGISTSHSMSDAQVRNSARSLKNLGVEVAKICETCNENNVKNFISARINFLTKQIINQETSLLRKFQCLEVLDSELLTCKSIEYEEQINELLRKKEWFKHTRLRKLMVTVYIALKSRR